MWYTKKVDMKDPQMGPEHLHPALCTKVISISHKNHKPSCKQTHTVYTHTLSALAAVAFTRRGMIP